MSLNSLIKEKLDAKRYELRNKYAKAKNDAKEKVIKELEPDIKKFRSQLQDLVDKAEAVGINLGISTPWRSTRPLASALANDDHKKVKSVLSSIEKEEKAELSKFDSLDEKAQLSALLPAKERRDEMAAILAEIAKF